MHSGNLLGALPDTLPAELFETILSTDRLRIERILSRGQSTPKGEWYEQEEHEWVLLVTGEALLAIVPPGEDEPATLRLGPGDYVNLPARCRHRVEWTAPDRVTVWLAIFY